MLLPMMSRHEVHSVGSDAGAGSSQLGVRIRAGLRERTVRRFAQLISHACSPLRRLRLKYLRNLGILLRRRQELAAALQVRLIDAVVEHPEPIVLDITSRRVSAHSPRTPLNCFEDYHSSRAG